MTTVINSQISPPAAESRPAKRHRTRNTGRSDDGKAADNSAEGTKDSPSEKIVRRGKKTRSNGEDFEEPNGVLAAGFDLNASSAVVSPDGPAKIGDKEVQSIGEDGSYTKRAFNCVLHNRLVAQRRKIDELRLLNKEKDRIINQYKTMWAKEKDKNQQLLDRFQEFEKKLAAMTRPLQWSIKSMTSANSTLTKITNPPASEHPTVIGH